MTLSIKFYKLFVIVAAVFFVLQSESQDETYEVPTTDPNRIFEIFTEYLEESDIEISQFKVSVLGYDYTQRIWYAIYETKKGIEFPRHFTIEVGDKNLRDIVVTGGV